MLDRLEPAIDVDVKIALALVAVLGLVAQRLDLAAQLHRLGAQHIDLGRELDEALVLDDALDADEARLEIHHLQLHRIFGRRDRAAANDSECDGDRSS